MCDIGPTDVWSLWINGFGGKHSFFHLSCLLSLYWQLLWDKIPGLITKPVKQRRKVILTYGKIWLQVKILYTVQLRELCSIVGCGSYQFACQNGRCISLSDRCDDINHCGDFSDELSCRTFVRDIQCWPPAKRSSDVCLYVCQMINFRKPWHKKFTFAHPVYLQAMRVMFVYEGYLVKVKITGGKT